MIHRIIKTTLAAGVICLTSFAANALDWEDAELYPFEEATLVYSISGMQNGTQETLIKEHGRKTAQFNNTTLSMMGVNQETNSATWMDADWIYTYDQTSGMATKMANPIKNMLQNVDDPKDAYLSFLTGMGGKEVGTDTHNGTACTVYEMGMIGSKMCISDNMVMQYMRMDMMGMTSNTELQSITIGPVDESKFEKPDVEFNEFTMPTGMGMPGSN